MSTTLHAYLNFSGRTEEAMKFYAEAIGGQLDIRRMGDSPMPCPPEDKNRVMHAVLTTDSIRLMASDAPSSQPVPAGTGGIHLSLNFTDKSEQDRVWKNLSQGGSITMPLGEFFFGRFGMLTDKFGMPWMLHFAEETK